jgi:hypothetical protein
MHVLPWLGGYTIFLDNALQKWEPAMLKQISLGIVLIAGLLVGNVWADDALNNALSVAAFSGDMAKVEALIAKGADVNAKDENGRTPLSWAAYYDKREVVELLISKGADINTKIAGDRTPLHEAIERGKKEVALFLISKGANVNAKTIYGKAPLYLAASEGHKDIVEILISKGADVYAKAEGGLTPLQVAEESLSDPKVRQEIIALLQGQMAKQSNPRQMLNSLLDQFKGHSDNDELRKSIIEAALKLKPAPAIPQEAEDAAGRAAYIFNNAKSEDDKLAVAKEYLKAVEVAPWVANYYFNLCTVLEKTPYTQQALHACKLYLEAEPNAVDAADMRQRIAGLKFAVDKNKEQIKQRTKYIGSGEIDDLYRFGGISGTVAGKDVAIKLFVDWQASPPKHQVFAACINGDNLSGRAYDLVSTDTWDTLCSTSFHIVIRPEGAGFVELGGSGSLRATLDELFQRKQKALEQSPIFKDYGYGSDKGVRFYVTYLQGGMNNQYAGYAMYESDCNGNPLRQDTRALPDDFFSQESGKMRNQQFPILLDYMGTPQSGCNDKFQSKTGYKFGENE